MTAIELPERHEWTVEDLVNLPVDLNYELINGRLVLPSPTPVHQHLTAELWLAVRASCPPEYIVSWDLSLEIDERNEPRPDVVVVRVEHIDRSPVPVRDAILAIEVVSGGNVFRDMFDKTKIYADAGIANYWIVEEEFDAEKQASRVGLTEMVLDREAGHYRTGRYTTGVFSVRSPWKIRIDLPALTTGLAALRGRRRGGE
jgi:hypothetical protein